MKNTNKTQLPFGFLILAMLLLTSITVRGQEASAFWPLTSVNNQIITNGNINAEGPLAAGCILKTFTYNSTITGTSPDFNPDQYLQFAVAPSAGCNFIANEITSNLSVTSNLASVDIQIWISLSPDFIDYQIIASEFSLIYDRTYYTFSLNKTVPDGEKLYIRIYPYGEHPDRTEFVCRVFDVEITGHTSPGISLSYEEDKWCTNEGTAEATITGTEGGTFSSEPGLAINTSTGSIDLNSSQPGTYTVNYTVSGEVIVATDVTIHSSPDCTIRGTDGPVCPSSALTFSAPDNLYYDWSVNGNGIISGNTNDSTVTLETGATTETSFTLSLTVENENGCISTCHKEILVKEAQPGMLPTATLTGTQSVCFGSSAELVVDLTGQEPWTFTWTDGDDEHTVETNDPQYLITVNPTGNTSYSLTGLVTDGNGCSNIPSGEANIYYGPVTTAPNIITCPNTTVEVPVTVKSFSDVRDISLTLQYDSNVMTYQGFQNGAIPFGTGDFSEMQVSDFPFNENFRALRISSTSGDNLPTLADDAVLLTLIFNYQGGTSDLTWIDSPDDSWCSYSFENSLDETGFEIEEFCDVPAEAYYISGSVKQLEISDTDVSPVPNISTITGTPVILPISVSYPDLEAQQVSPEILSDLKLSYDGTGTFPSGARIFKVLHNGISVLSSPIDIGTKSNVLMSETLGTADTPLLNHSDRIITWEFYIDGIDFPGDLPLKIEALAYTQLKECVVVLDAELFNISFADAELSVTESATVCEAEPLEFTAEIGYPVINNLNTAIKADARITAATPFPEGTTVNWSYNGSTNGSYTLPINAAEMMLSTITGTLPNPLQGHSDSDVWSFIISNTGLMADNVVTIEAVAMLDGEQYVHSEDQVILTVNSQPEVTAVTLQASTDQINWTEVTGDLSAGYTMCADPAVAYHYLDIAALTVSTELSSEFEKNAFYLDINSVPAEFYQYWNAKGVNASASDNWQAVMWNIINGEAPMFYINYDGFDYNLVDGLQHIYNNNTDNLRISGDYPAGSYTFNGSVTGSNGCTSEVFDVTLNLNSAPVITCPGTIEKKNESGLCGAAVLFEVTATGSPAPKVTCTLTNGTQVTTGDFFPVGTTTVTVTAANDYKTVTCTFDVTVIDNEAPVISCPVNGNLDVKINNTNTYMHSGTDWDVSASDNCSQEVPASYTLTGATEGTGISLDGIAFNLGTTTVTWNGEDAAGNISECTYTVSVSGVALSGTVKYYNREATPLDGLTVTLKQPDTGAEMASTTTNAAGEYSFVHLCPGIYNVDIETGKPVRSINSTDAGQVNAWNVAQSGDNWPSIEKVRFLAGDANGDNWINAQDAGIIQNHFLTFGTEVTFDRSWEFWKTNDFITSQPQPDNILQIAIPEESSGIIQDFYGMVSGDFNRSNTPSAGTINSLVIKSARTHEGYVTLLKGKELMAGAEEIFELPVRTESSMQVGAISLILDFPADRVKVLDVYLKDDPNQAAGFNVMDNMLIIGWNSVTPLSVKADEPLLTVSLQITEGEKEMPVFFELASSPLNELADENMIAINNASLIMDGLVMKETITGIEETGLSKLMLTCWPNPFGDNATIKYRLPAEGSVNLDVIGTSGNRISLLHNQQQPAGEYIIDFNETNLVPGVYHIVLRLTLPTGHQKITSTSIIKH